MKLLQGYTFRVYWAIALHMLQSRWNENNGGRGLFSFSSV